MIDKALVKKIQSNPDYQELVAKRSSFAWKLTFAILIVYYAYILIIAFKPSIFGTPIAEGMTTTVGIPVGVAIILFSFAITGYYIKKSNSYYEELTNRVKKEIEKEIS